MKQKKLVYSLKEMRGEFAKELVSDVDEWGRFSTKFDPVQVSGGLVGLEIISEDARQKPNYQSKFL